jgi:hypothetical protein
VRNTDILVGVYILPYSHLLAIGDLDSGFKSEDVLVILVFESQGERFDYFLESHVCDGGVLFGEHEDIGVGV